MAQKIITPSDWDILDKYIEDMLVAVKMDEISISTAKSYISHYLYEVSYTDLDVIINNIRTRSHEMRQHGWARSH